MAPWRAVRAYIAHPDPRVAAGNLIAVMVAWNQPFYPLYLYFVVGPDIGVSFLTFLSTPFFAAVPWVARRRSRLGRALLPIAGIANAVLSAKAFGEASGVEMFFAPCITIAALLFRGSERLVMLAVVSFGFAAYLGFHGRYGTPLHTYSPEEYARFFNLNALSVLTLSAFVGITFASTLAETDAGR